MSRKTIFFIDPHNVVRNKLYDSLIDEEHEVYFLNDYTLFPAICRSFSSPLIIINPDRGRSFSFWKTKLKELSNDGSLSHVKIAIATYNRSLLEDPLFISLPDRYSVLLLRNEKTDGTAEIIQLIRNHTKERNRKYLRADCRNEETSFNVKIDGIFEYGTISEISSVGMSVQFQTSIDLLKNSFLPDIQIKLKGSLLLLSAVVAGFRTDPNGKKIYVLLFDGRTPENSRSKIRHFVSKVIHGDVEKELAVQMRRRLPVSA
ncbi:hypothetical protein [Spirochaeta isovalerica]|uniref:PilZ domain-containing protein n=1 Tax=Spirochaeta isovalerica TaxID=150 RepID=A0A841RHU3_9SPIO|nr:hypothetical protein [Spirochaeta isovalerica]MBB6482580.1 hypothetical protein [Spirochaeta isovalerica]